MCHAHIEPLKIWQPLEKYPHFAQQLIIFPSAPRGRKRNKYKLVWASKENRIKKNANTNKSYRTQCCAQHLYTNKLERDQSSESTISLPLCSVACKHTHKQTRETEIWACVIIYFWARALRAVCVWCVIKHGRECNALKAPPNMQ
jgi:hypothetical protein